MDTILRIDQLEINDPDNGIWTTSTNIWNNPERNVFENDPQQADGAISTFQKYVRRIIEINGKIEANSIEDWRLKLEDLKRRASRAFVDIVLREGATPELHYNCIIKKIDIDKGTMPDFATFKIIAWHGDTFATGDTETSNDFTVVSPVSTPKRVDTIFYTNTHQHTSTAEIKPVINVVINSFSQAVSFTSVPTHMAIGNPDNGRLLTLDFNPNSTTHIDLAVGDVFRIDCLNRTILRNGKRIYAEGVFPLWDAANVNNKLRFECNSDASFDATFNTSFVHRYL